MNSKISRRDLLKTGVGAFAWLTLRGNTGNVMAQPGKYPSGPISVLNPAKPGGGWDLMTRMISPALEKQLGQPIRADFLPGAAGQIAFKRLMDLPPDGHAMVISTVTLTSLMLKFLKPKGITENDLDFVGSIVVEPDVLVVHKDAPWDSITDFIKEARVRPIKISAVGPLNNSHVAALVLKERSGAKLNIIMYPGGSPARNAVVNKEVDATVAALYSASPIYGSTKGIGVFWRENPAPDIWDMPVANKVLDFKMPDFLEPSAFYVPAKFVQEHPKQYEFLARAYGTAFADRLTKETADKLNYPTRALRYMKPEELRSFAKEYLALVEQFAHLLKPR